MRRRKTRTRPLEVGAAALAALFLSACGGEARRSPPPTLQRAVARTLAARSDAVAAALEAGDSCRALTLARQLQRETIAAINGGRVTAAFQEELSSAVNDLTARVTCAPPAAPAAPPPVTTTADEDREPERERGTRKGHAKQHGAKKKHGKHD